MNKKGFTLVELLGVIVILGIIMLVAIPNIASLTQKNKKNTYIVDAKKMVSLVQYELRKGGRDKPGDGAVEVFDLESLSTSDVEKNADGIEYDTSQSYVAVYRENGYLKYAVQLVTGESGQYDGIILTRVENLDGKKKYDHYKENNAGISPSNTSQIITAMGQEDTDD